MTTDRGPQGVVVLGKVIAGAVSALVFGPIVVLLLLSPFVPLKQEARTQSVGGTVVPIVPTTGVARVPAPVPTMPPLAPVDVAFTGKLEREVARVGDKLVFEFGFTNRSDRPVEGVSVLTNGPWEKYTVLNVTPRGGFEPNERGYLAQSDIVVPPGETRHVRITAYPKEPGAHAFTFVPATLGGSYALGSGGDPIVVADQVVVGR